MKILSLNRDLLVDFRLEDFSSDIFLASDSTCALKKSKQMKLQFFINFSAEQMWTFEKEKARIYTDQLVKVWFSNLQTTIKTRIYR